MSKLDKQLDKLIHERTSDLYHYVVNVKRAHTTLLEAGFAEKEATKLIMSILSSRTADSKRAKKMEQEDQNG